MGKDLKKFVNPRFMKTIDLALLRRLFERQRPDQRGIDMAVFDGEDAEARDALLDFFSGPETAIPPGLVADLHRIAELGNENGMRILLEQADRRGIVLLPPVDDEGQPVRIDPKHLALLAFLGHEDVFNAASDLLVLELRLTLTEFAGADEGVEPRLTEAARREFEQAARELFTRDLQGGYCRLAWYEDDDEINLVVTHGTPITVITAIEADQERVISFQAAGHAVLAYSPLTGRLKVGGIAKARRRDFAEIFASTMLGQPDFFAGADSQNLYTLEPIERQGFEFVVDRAFDPDIERAQIVEVQVDRISTDDEGSVRVHWSMVARDNRESALARLAETTRGIVFGPDSFRIGHIVLRLQFRVPNGRPAKVTIKIKPPSTASFKRHRFESRIMDLLRRNGFCHNREPAEASVAAE